MSLIQNIDDQAERAVTALEICQRDRNLIREERDAALAEVGRLRGLIDVGAFPLLTLDQVNALPEAAGDWLPPSSRDKVVKVLLAALAEQRRLYALRVEQLLRA